MPEVLETLFQPSVYGHLVYSRSLKALEFQEVFVGTMGVKKRKNFFCQEDPRMVKLDM
jgi:hypothetical protein